MTEQLHDARHRLFDAHYRVSSSLRAAHVLSSLQREHVFCTFWLEGRSTSFNTLLLEVREADGLLGVDVPLNFPKVVPSGSAIAMLARINGIISGFRSAIVRIEGDVVVVRYPDAVYQLQRRQLYRVPPTVQDPDQVEIYRQGAQRVMGRMQDVSAGGLRILASCPKDYPFRQNEVVPQLIFTIRGGESLHMPAIIRFVEPHRPGAMGVMLGVEFQNPPAADRERVAQYVQARDREILRVLGIGLHRSAKAETVSWKNLIKRWWKT